ncbi:MAG: hypothetical protein MK080_11100 [Opitutales bacterium]|nr:hypothetical protein [Opitutales bacterium]NRA27324.1 hypothetical protein [Opitutales bacterium]
MAVVEGAGSRHILFDYHYTLNGTNSALLSQKQQAWVPYLFTKSVDRTSYIGTASGISANATLDLPVSELTTAELIPEVMQAAKDHFEPWNTRLFNDPRVTFYVGDGRHLLTHSDSPQDLVICDLFLPSRAGSSHLYSVDFFRAVRATLSPEGSLCLWLPAYQLNAESMQVIMRTFSEVFEHALILRGNFDAIQPTIALLGSAHPFDISEASILDRLQHPTIQYLRDQSLFFRSVGNARLALIGDLKTMNDQLEEYPINSDDRPWISFNAPRRIENGERIRGTTLLDFMGRSFLTTPWPSTLLNRTEIERLRPFIRAGNYAYASRVAAFPVPDISAAETLKRQTNATRLELEAMRLAPGIDLRSVEN